MAAINPAGFNAAGRACNAPWFQNPAQCVVGRQYLFRRFINGYERTFLHTGTHNTVRHGQYGEHPQNVIAYAFEEVPTRMIGAVRAGMWLYEDLNDGCLKEVDGPNSGPKQTVEKPVEANNGAGGAGGGAAAEPAPRGGPNREQSRRQTGGKRRRKLRKSKRTRRHR